MATTTSRRPTSRSTVERVSRLIEQLDHRPGAHARHLARTRRISAGKNAMVAGTVIGVGVVADTMAATHDGWGGLVAIMLAIVAWFGHWLEHHRRRARQAGLEKLLPHARFWPVPAISAVGLLVLEAVFTARTEVVLGVGASVTAIGLALWHFRVKPLVAGARQADAGARNELSVAHTIDATGVRVRHSAMLGAGGDADHVIVGTEGQLAVIETKSGGGRVRVDEHGAIRCGKKRIVGDPIEQVQRQARALSRLAGGAAVTAIVCVQHQSNEPFRSHGVLLCGERHLGQIVQRLPRRLSTAEADALWKRLPSH